MNAKHTPGPWHRNIKPAKKYGVIFAGSNTHVAVLRTDGLTDNEIEGNCNLIAAAPELLAALKDIVDNGIGTKAKAIAVAAIDKAEGK